VFKLLTYNCLTIGRGALQIFVHHGTRKEHLNGTMHHLCRRPEALGHSARYTESGTDIRAVSTQVGEFGAGASRPISRVW